MSKFIKDTVKNIEISGIRQFNQYALQFDQVINLTIGELDLFTPEVIKEETINAIKNNKTKYTPNKGINELLEELSKEYKNYNKDNFIVTVGTTEGLCIIIQSIINEGDEVIIPTPAYVGYKPLIDLQKGIVKEVNTLKTNGFITKDSLEQAYTNKTKCLLVTSPNNPTGHVLNKEEIEIIIDFVLEKDILLISDEIYHSITYVETNSFTEYTELKDNLITLNGFSKSHAMTGFRIGYIVSNKEIIDHLVKVHQYSVTSATTISQYAALKALTTSNESILNELKLRRDFCIQELNNLGLNYLIPNGAFYIFINISKYQKDSITFCQELVKKEKLALIPGTYFLGDTDSYIRLSYASDLETLKEAFKRLSNYIKTI